jgi:hypothetical protein
VLASGFLVQDIGGQVLMNLLTIWNHTICCVFYNNIYIYIYINTPILMSLFVLHSSTVEPYSAFFFFLLEDYFKFLV